VPNVNVMDDLEVRIARLNDDEKRLFALICRSYLAAVMPDFEYRQTVVTMKVPLPEQGSGAAVEFRAVGRIPLKQGWKAAFGAAEPESGREKEGEAETDQTLPQLVDGQNATLTRPRVQSPSPRMRATAIFVLSYKIDWGTPPKKAKAETWPSQKASVVSPG